MINPLSEPVIQECILLAEAWQKRANELLTHEEKGIQEQMLRLVTHPMDKVVLTKLIDQSFRSENQVRIADQISDLLGVYGVPDFFSRVEKLLVQMFLGLGRHFPTLSIPKLIDKMRHESSRAIIPGETEILHAHLQKRRKQGVRININHLGEAVLGEREASNRLKTYLADMENPEIEYISIKISTIYSQIQSIAFDQSICILKDRLSLLLEAAGKNSFIREDGASVPKFINLDMEEYRDLEITAEAFRQTLDQDKFKNHSAGIALQAYLPDSFPIQKDLTEWAQKRVSEGGAPIKIRIVKGANMEMEMVESAIRNWPLAPYDNKVDVDANFKRMVEYGMDPKRIKAAHLGIASHNLFELAYAYTLAKKQTVTPHFSFEMLEGMADHVRRAISETSEELVLYAPIASKDQFINAIAYLIRRLDENTAEDNFLRYSFHLEPKSEAWEMLKTQFIDSFTMKDSASTKPHRTQNRLTEVHLEKKGTFFEDRFDNEPDTDWSLPGNRMWAESIRKKWKLSNKDNPPDIPLVVGGTEIFQGREAISCYDPNRFGDRICVARFISAGEEDVDRAVAIAKTDPDGWRLKTWSERHKMLSRAAARLRLGRADLIGSAAANTGKVFTEADAEVSEAVDFAEYYPHAVKTFAGISNLNCRGKGVGVVISPWNFPIAIPCGGIVAALAAGNTVIFKPASSAVLVAWELCRCFWDAGISKNTLQFLPGTGSKTGKRIATHPDIDFVIFTGGTETGIGILTQRPELYLAAETGGKNATIVTAMSDRDQAIRNVVYSVFGNCGQKCSATSLLILEDEVYQSEHFRDQLVDAAESLGTGSAWDFQNRMGPLIRPPDEDLRKALTELEPGESWALKPKNIDGNPHLWTPGIKYGVSSGSHTHMTEFFGPLLGVMRARDLNHAIELANQTGYGLTSAIESLDPREQELWKKKIRAGNLYINRGTTGAVVLRQPFGGMGKSAIGPGIKVGYANYLSQFMEFSETDFPKVDAIEREHTLLRTAQQIKLKLDWGQIREFKQDMKKIVYAIESYLFRHEQEFGKDKDYFHLRGQDNILRYLPVGRLVIRLHEKDTMFDVLARLSAAVITECDPVISIPVELNNRVTDFIFSRYGKPFVRFAEMIRQTDSELIDSFPQIHRIRYAAADRVPINVSQKAAEIGFYISKTPVMMEGRIELLQYLQNQSICDSYHRYGNLGERGIG